MTAGELMVVIGSLTGGVLLAALLVAARRAVDLLPMPAERRELLARASPVVGTTLVLAYVLVALGAVVGERPGVGAALVAVLLLLVVAAAWPALRDVASGVALKSGRACRVGDYVRLGGIQGRVQRLGLRTLTLETSDGDEAVVPYGRLVGETVYRSPAQERAAHHVFRIRTPESKPLWELKEAIRIAAFHVHWHSVAREPQATVIGDGTLEVTVFPIHPDRGPEIEAAVRAAVGSRPSPAAEPKRARGGESVAPKPS